MTDIEEKIPVQLKERFPNFWDQRIEKTRQHKYYRYARLGHINPDFQATHKSEMRNEKLRMCCPESKAEVDKDLETVIKNRTPVTKRPARWNRSV